MGRHLEKNYLFCDPYFLSIFRPSFVRYIYIGNIRLIYWTNCTLNRNKTHTQNKSDKIVFAQTASHTPFEKNDFVTLVFSAYLYHYLSDINIRNIRLIQYIRQIVF